MKADPVKENPENVSDFSPRGSPIRMQLIDNEMEDIDPEVSA